MSELKLRELITSQNHGEYIRAKEILHEAILWLEHIERSEILYDRNLNGIDGARFILNDIVTNYCSLINWLATISMTRGYVSNQQIATFLHNHFQWPKHVCETFMNCVRNPSVHMGRAYPWGTYDAMWSENKSVHGEGYLFHGTIDQNISELSLKFKINPQDPNVRVKKEQIFELGFIESNLINDGPDGPHYGIVFFMPGIKVKTRSTIEAVFSEFKSRTSEQLEEFEELSNKLGLTRVPAPENYA